MLNIINPGSKTLRISCPKKRKDGITEYENIKSKIKKSTLRYGAAVSTYHFIFHTPIDGISASLGTIASYVYIDSLSSYVDNIEKSFGLNKGYWYQRVSHYLSLCGIRAIYPLILIWVRHFLGFLYIKWLFIRF